MKNPLLRSGWKGTRLIMAWAMFIVGSAGWFAGNMDGPTWVALCAFVAGIYNASEVGVKQAASKAVIAKVQADG